MAAPHVPLWTLVTLLFAATMFAPPFESARASITPAILPGDQYALGTAVIQTTMLAGQVAGAASGGLAIAFIGVPPGTGPGRRYLRRLGPDRQARHPSPARPRPRPPRPARWPECETDSGSCSATPRCAHCCCSAGK
jgi:hypothetical protein